MGSRERINSPGILLPYQQRWVSDASPLKIWLAARQIGKSFSVATEAVGEAVGRRCTNLLLSSSERQSRELMQKVQMHLRYFAARSSEEVRTERSTQDEVVLPNGSRIISLPANPDTVRGFSGNIFLDEFAFHHDSREIWRAMYPTVTRGYKVRITSTPNGRQNMFHDLWTKDDRFSKHRTDIYAAVGEGLKVDVEALRKGISDPESWEQEFRCRFLDEATAYITYEMITASEDDGATREFEGNIQDGEFYLGVDIGRKRDLTVFWLIEKVGDVCWTRMVRELAGQTFRIQRDELYFYLPHVRRCCIDASGIGAQLAEEATERFGPRAEAVLFTRPVKEDLAVTVRRKFEDRELRIPADRNIREDIHSVRKLTTVSGNVRFDAERTGDSHADRFWALALALHASDTETGRVSYEPLGQRDFQIQGCI